MELPVLFIVALAVIWALQSIFVYRQGKAFMRRIGELRKLGRVAIGVGYNRIRIRTFVVVVVDRRDRVVDVERLSGLTVFARTRSFHRFSGLALSELSDVARAQGLPAQQLAALDQAVQALMAGVPDEGHPGDDHPASTENQASLGEEEGGRAISQAI